MTRRTPPRKVTYFEPVPPRLARNTIIESTFEVGRRFRCTMRVDCSQLDPVAVIRPIPGEMGLQYDTGLRDVEIVDSRRVNACQDLGEEVGLLLVVAFQADPVGGVDDRFEKRLRVRRRHDLALGVVATCFQAVVPSAPLPLPLCHISPSPI
jgi:hypothetical protein